MAAAMAEGKLDEFIKQEMPDKVYVQEYQKTGRL